MELEFISRVIKVTLIVAVISLVVVGFYYGLSYGLGIFAGAVWGCVNLYFIRQMVRNTLTLEQKDYLKIFTILGIKFPMLYLAGYGLLRIKYLPPLNLLLGFSLVFAVIFLKGLGRVFLDKTQVQKGSKVA
jgi:hypothetical protein